MISSVSTVINAPVEDVWQLIGDFTTWHEWLPVIEATTMVDGQDQGPVGSVRIMTTANGTGREKLVMKDELNRSLTYTIEGPTPMPMRTYVSTVRVYPVTTSGTTFVHWSADMDTEAEDEQTMYDLFQGIYVSFFDAIKARVEPAGRG